MKVTIVIDAPHYIGGIRYIERFIKLLAIAEKDIDVNLIYVNCSSSIEASCKRKERFVKIPRFLYRLDRLIARFTKVSLFSLFFLGDFKQRIVFFSDVFLPKFLRDKYQIKIIHWFPDFQVYDLVQAFSKKDQLSRKLYIKLQLQTSDFLLTQSDTDCKRMKSIFPEYSDKIVKWSFAEPKFFVEELEELNVNGTTLKSKEFLLYPHQGWTHKNHLLLIDVLQSFEGETLVLTGRLSDPRDDGYSNRLKQAIDDSRAKIINLGLVNAEDLNLLMKNTKAILNFSKYEGWSSCVEEGIMLDTPLVLSNIKIHLEQCPEAYFVDISTLENAQNSFARVLLEIKEFKGYNHDVRLINSVEDLKKITLNIYESPEGDLCV